MDSGSKQTREQMLRVRRGPFKAFCNLPSWTRWTAVVFFSFWFLNLMFGLSVDHDTRGTFGDTFGAVNSFFSGAALLGIAYGVWLQRGQLFQAEAEIKHQKENIERQHKAEDKRMFEATFFQLLSSLNDITKNTIIVEHKHINDMNDDEFTEVSTTGKDIVIGEHKGHKAFKRFYELVFHEYNEGPPDDYFDLDFEASEEHRLFRHAYYCVYQEYGVELSQYFRTLFTALNFIDKAELGDDQWFYAKLIRAQLSNIEASVLALNYLSDHTTPKFNALIEKYGMLKNAQINLKDIPYLKEIPTKARGQSNIREEEIIKEIDQQLSNMDFPFD